MQDILKVLIVLSVVSFNGAYVSYRDYKLYDVIPTKSQYEALYNWQYEDGVDFWRTYAPGYPSKIMIAPNRQKEFEAFLMVNNITNQVLINDVEVTLEEERQEMTKNRRGKTLNLNPANPDFSLYWTTDQIQTYCQYLANTFPNLVQMQTITVSPGGRLVYALLISNGVFGQKPIIAMEGGMHAREWASPPTVLYLIHRLIQNPTSSAELLARLDWLIVPMHNPDGYEWSITTNRLWRQNRRQVNPTCIGVDLNRNNEYTWRQATAAQPCGSLTFPGPTPFSETESIALHNLVARYASNVKLYLSVHTFGDMVLWPWGYSGSPGWIGNWEEHHHVGNLWANAITGNGGRSYIVGNTAEVLGNAFGAIDDHMAGQLRIPLVYTLEITSGFQFTYPEGRVLNLVEETFWGYRAMALYVANRTW